MSSKLFEQKTSQEVLAGLKDNPGNSIVNLNNNASDAKEGKYILIKDIHNCLELPTTNASRILKGYNSCYDATIIKNLKAAGFSILGTTNLDEFAMGSTTKTSCYGPVDNVLADGNVSGGSSGGSAYVVAKGLVPFATGTDTGGSIRQPAAFNGIYGLKPTYGLVSRYGTLSFASSFDTIGPMSKTLEDNAYLLKVLASNDAYDQSNYMPKDFDPFKTFDQPIDGLKIGVMRSWLDGDIDPEIKQAIEQQIAKLESLGASIIDVDAPLTKYSFSLYITLAYAEASSNFNRYDGIRFGLEQNKQNPSYEQVRAHFGTEVKKRLIIGTYMLSSEHSIAYFQKAQKLRNMMCEEFKDIFNQVDVIIGPTTPSLAFKQDQEREKLESYLSDQFTIPANLVGFCSLNVPIATSKDGRFIGMQIMGDKYQEHKLYQVAKSLKGVN